MRPVLSIALSGNSARQRMRVALAALMLVAAAAVLVFVLGRGTASAEDLLSEVSSDLNTAASTNGADGEQFAPHDTPYSPLASSRIAYYADWWLRTPGDRCDTYLCYTSLGTGSGGLMPSGWSLEIGQAVRPALFIDLSALSGYKAALKVGMCVDDEAKSCFRFGSYSFDVIGINRDGAKSGICTMTATDGYTDNSGAQCPNNTIQILLSNSSSTKPPKVPFRSSLSTTANNYFDSNLNTAINNFYTTVSSLRLDSNAAYPTLASVIVNRNLAGGASNTGNGGNKCAGPAPGARSAFPLSYSEARALHDLADDPPEVPLLNPQAPLTLTTEIKSANQFTVTYGGGSGTGNYWLHSNTTPVCIVPDTKTPNVGTVAVTLVGVGTCELRLEKNGDAQYSLASEIIENYTVGSLTFNKQTSADTGFEGTPPNTTPTGTNPDSIYALPGTVLALVGPNQFAREGYYYSAFCTNKDFTGTCSGGSGYYTMPDGKTTLYPAWVGNRIYYNYLNSAGMSSGFNPPSTNACTYGTSFTPSQPIDQQGSWHFLGYSTSDPGWNSATGSMNTTVAAQYASASTTCHGNPGNPTMNADFNLYTVLELNPVRLQFDAMGGSLPSPGTIVGSSLGIYPLAEYTGTKTGYTFAGWQSDATNPEYNETACRGTHYPAGGTYNVVTTAYTHNFYACWLDTVAPNVPTEGGALASVINLQGHSSVDVTIPAGSDVGGVTPVDRLSYKVLVTTSDSVQADIDCTSNCLGQVVDWTSAPLGNTTDFTFAWDVGGTAGLQPGGNYFTVYVKDANGNIQPTGRTYGVGFNPNVGISATGSQLCAANSAVGACGNIDESQPETLWRLGQPDGTQKMRIRLTWQEARISAGSKPAGQIAVNTIDGRGVHLHDSIYGSSLILENTIPDPGGNIVTYYVDFVLVDHQIIRDTNEFRWEAFYDNGYGGVPSIGDPFWNEAMGGGTYRLKPVETRIITSTFNANGKTSADAANIQIAVVPASCTLPGQVTTAAFTDAYLAANGCLLSDSGNTTGDEDNASLSAPAKQYRAYGNYHVSVSYPTTTHCAGSDFTYSSANPMGIDPAQGGQGFPGFGPLDYMPLEDPPPVTPYSTTCAYTLTAAKTAGSNIVTLTPNNTLGNFNQYGTFHIDTLNFEPLGSGLEGPKLDPADWFDDNADAASFVIAPYIPQVVVASGRIQALTASDSEPVDTPTHSDSAIIYVLMKSGLAENAPVSNYICAMLDASTPEGNLITGAPGSEGCITQGSSSTTNTQFDPQPALTVQQAGSYSVGGGQPLAGTDDGSGSLIIVPAGQIAYAYVADVLENGNVFPGTHTISANILPHPRWASQTAPSQASFSVAKLPVFEPVGASGTEWYMTAAQNSLAGQVDSAVDMQRLWEKFYYDRGDWSNPLENVTANTEHNVIWVSLGPDHSRGINRLPSGYTPDGGTAQNAGNISDDVNQFDSKGTVAFTLKKVEGEVRTVIPVSCDDAPAFDDLYLDDGFGFARCLFPKLEAGSYTFHLAYTPAPVAGTYGTDWGWSDQMFEAEEADLTFQIAENYVNVAYNTSDGATGDAIGNTSENYTNLSSQLGNLYTASNAGNSVINTTEPLAPAACGDYGSTAITGSSVAYNNGTANVTLDDLLGGTEGVGKLGYSDSEKADVLSRLDLERRCSSVGGTLYSYSQFNADDYVAFNSGSSMETVTPSSIMPVLPAGLNATATDSASTCGLDASHSGDPCYSAKFSVTLPQLRLSRLYPSTMVFRPHTGSLISTTMLPFNALIPKTSMLLATNWPDPNNLAIACEMPGAEHPTWDGLHCSAAKNDYYARSVIEWVAPNIDPKGGAHFDLSKCDDDTCVVKTLVSNADVDLEAPSYSFQYSNSVIGHAATPRYTLGMHTAALNPKIGNEGKVLPGTYSYCSNYISADPAQGSTASFDDTEPHCIKLYIDKAELPGTLTTTTTTTTTTGVNVNANYTLTPDTGSVRETVPYLDVDGGTTTFRVCTGDSDVSTLAAARTCTLVPAGTLDGATNLQTSATDADARTFDYEVPKFLKKGNYKLVAVFEGDAAIADTFNVANLTIEAKPSVVQLNNCVNSVISSPDTPSGYSTCPGSMLYDSSIIGYSDDYDKLLHRGFDGGSKAVVHQDNRIYVSVYDDKAFGWRENTRLENDTSGKADVFPALTSGQSTPDPEGTMTLGIYNFSGDLIQVLTHKVEAGDVVSAHKRLYGSQDGVPKNSAQYGFTLPDLPTGIYYVMPCYNGDIAYDADCFGNSGDNFEASDFAGTGDLGDKVGAMQLSEAGKAKITQMRRIEIDRAWLSSMGGSKFYGHFVDSANCSRPEFTPKTMDAQQFYCVYVDTTQDDSGYRDIPASTLDYHAPGPITVDFRNNITGPNSSATCDNWQRVAANQYTCLFTLGFDPSLSATSGSLKHTTLLGVSPTVGRSITDDTFKTGKNPSLAGSVDLSTPDANAFIAQNAGLMSLNIALGREVAPGATIANNVPAKGNVHITATKCADPVSACSKVQAGAQDVTTSVFADDNFYLNADGTVSVPFLSAFAELGLPKGVYLLTLDEYYTSDDTFKDTIGSPVMLNQFSNEVQVTLVIGGLDMCYNSGLNDAQLQECLQSELDDPANHLIQMTNNFTKKHDDPANTGVDAENIVTRISAQEQSRTLLSARTTAAPFMTNSDLELWAYYLPSQKRLSPDACPPVVYGVLETCTQTDFINYPAAVSETFIGKATASGGAIAHFALPNDLSAGNYYLVFKEVATGQIAVGYLDLLAREDALNELDDISGGSNGSGAQHGHCSDLRYATQQYCEDNGGIWTRPGTWTPCEEPSWSPNYATPNGCDEAPPRNGTPYPLPDTFPDPGDGWTCVGGICTNPDYPGWECNAAGECDNDDYAPALPGWHCTPQGICKQVPPNEPEIVCDMNLGQQGVDGEGRTYYTGLCWEVPPHDKDNLAPGWSCTPSGNCTPPHGDKPYPPARISVSKETVLYHEIFNVSGRDFAPNAPVDVYLHSSPHKLGTALTNAQGTFTLDASIPLSSGVESGQHIISAEDVRSSYDVLRSVPVEIGIKLNLADFAADPFVCTDANGNVLSQYTTREACELAGGHWVDNPDYDAGTGTSGGTPAGTGTSPWALLFLLCIALAVGVRIRMRNML